jgi:hypothetical protein
MLATITVLVLPPRESCRCRRCHHQNSWEADITCSVDGMLPHFSIASYTDH